ncbi:MAG: hypothetical protein A3H96_08580 [Acidobacteria bacterium RIFCSPLOWO2_02_FULL_67_36]|nr:MAG: hypothetical protein A3H96_08580 [Acidobacteria bacterium RIFCSPLOWO2_02_FULL_67_36]
MTPGSLVRKLLAGALIGLGAAGLVCLVAWTGRLESTELLMYDWRMRLAADPASVSRDIVLVEINDTTIRDLEPVAGRWPWPRVVLSSLIDYLNRAPAKVVAIDFSFLEHDRILGYSYGGDTWSGKESDAALVDSVRQAPNVVLLADAIYEGVTGAPQQNAPARWNSAPYRLGPLIEERRVIVPPFQELTDAASGLGHNFLPLDPGGSARRMPPFVRSGDRYLPSLGVATALKALDVRPDEVTLGDRAVHIRDRVVPLVSTHVRNVDDPSKTHHQWTMLVKYRAPALVNGSRPYQSYEARHLLYSEEQINAGQNPMVDPSVFKDKIVFVGLTASGLVDVFQTPFNQPGQGKMPGIQVHASMADGVLSNQFIARAGSTSAVVTTIAVALVVGLMSALLPFVAALAGAVVIVGGWTMYAIAAFKQGTWVDMTQPMGASAIALFAGTAYRYFVEGREKRVVQKLFGRYVSRDVYSQLLKNPERAELGGARRDMSVLFSDIRGFTTVTERGDPEALVEQLNEYFSRMVAIVFRHGGTVDKFVGDMVMALFGAPLDDPSHPDHAVLTAVDMVKELGELNRKWVAEGKPALDIGVGVNSGEMIAGNIGSSSIMSYTVIGDNVNLGSRLESLNKQYGTRIIISGATRARLTLDLDIHPLGDVVVKGKSQAVAIFDVRLPSPLPAVGRGAARGGGAPASDELGGVPGAPPVNVRGAARGGGAPASDELGGVQGSPPVKKDVET